jgi:hypothetical protein
MTPHEWFTLVLRAFGVWELILTCDQVAAILTISTGAWKPRNAEIGAYISHGLEAFFIGIGLLIAAPIFAGFFYPRKSAQGQPASPQVPPQLSRPDSN